MLEILALCALVTAVILLIILVIIDFKTYLLPNIYVFPFATLGIVFHWLNDFALLDPRQIVLGGVLGYAMMYTIRWGGNKYYKQDSLGLGDVKLLAAAGLWFGFTGVLFAMTFGAFASLIHGIIIAVHQSVTKKTPFTISRLTIPAGPGFIVGILMVGFWKFHAFVQVTLYNLFL